MSKGKNWGGARPGAGRKAPEGSRVSVSLRVLPEIRDKVKWLKEQGVDVRSLIEDYIRELL